MSQQNFTTTSTEPSSSSSADTLTPSAPMSELDLQLESENYLRSLPASEQKVLSEFQKTQALIKQEQKRWNRVRLPLLSGARQYKQHVLEALGTDSNVCVDVTSLLSEYTKLSLRQPKTKTSDSASSRPRKKAAVEKPCFLRIKNTTSDRAWSIKMLTNWLDSIDPQFAARCFLDAAGSSSDSTSNDANEKDTVTDVAQDENASTPARGRKKIALAPTTKIEVAEHCRKFASKVTSSMSLTCVKPRDLSLAKSNSKTENSSLNSTTSSTTKGFKLVPVETLHDADKQALQQFLSCKDEYTRQHNDYKPRQKALQDQYQRQSVLAKQILSRFSNKTPTRDNVLFNCKVLTSDAPETCKNDNANRMQEDNENDSEEDNKREHNTKKEKSQVEDENEGHSSESDDEDAKPTPKITEMRLKQKVHTVKVQIKYKAMPIIVENAMRSLKTSGIAYSLDVFREFVIRAYNEYVSKHSKTEERIKFHRQQRDDVDEDN